MENKLIQCPICAGSETKEMFEAVVLKRYPAKYRFCEKCKFLFVEEPSWLKEAYKDPININDTGIMFRNIYLSKKASGLLYFLFKPSGKFLDYGGGYGIFTRLMRDVGFDFYWYDPYTTNLFARGFEFTEGKFKPELVTCFEVFEHLENPLNELEKIFRLCDNILFTTEILPESIPRPGEWWYYGCEHGQHISFYSLTTLDFLARKFGYNFYSNGKLLHLFTRRTLRPGVFRFLVKMANMGLFQYVKLRLTSKMADDSNLAGLSSKKEHP